MSPLLPQSLPSSSSIHRKPALFLNGEIPSSPEGQDKTYVPLKINLHYSLWDGV